MLGEVTTTKQLKVYLVSQLYQLTSGPATHMKEFSVVSVEKASNESFNPSTVQFY